MFLTQPAVSEQIRRLERDHDVLLFRRDHRRVSLTKAGRDLFVLTRQMFEVEEQIEEMLSEARSSLEGTLRIIADSTYHIAEILRRFQSTYPKVFVSIRSGNTAAIIESLRNYDAEIGIVGSLTDTRDFRLIELGSTPIVAFAAKGVFPKSRGTISVEDLGDMRLVFREPGSTTRQKIEETAQKIGVDLAPAIEAEGREAVREIVAAGIGVGFVSEAEFGHDDRIKRYRIEGVEPSMNENVVCLQQRKDVRVIRTFMQVARETVSAGLEEAASQVKNPTSA
jgi:aminoethylphosphonate catabolism LysR family transcriptional regulator